jgi:hypothetical protein
MINVFALKPTRRRKRSARTIRRLAKKWLASLPPPPVHPTEDDWQARGVFLEQQLTELWLRDPEVRWAVSDEISRESRAAARRFEARHRLRHEKWLKKRAAEGREPPGLPWPRARTLRTAR